MRYALTMACLYGVVLGVCLSNFAMFYHLWLFRLRPMVLPDRPPLYTGAQSRAVYAKLKGMARRGLVVMAVVGAVNIYVSGLAASHGDLVPDLVTLIAVAEAVRCVRRRIAAGLQQAPGGLG